MKRSFDIVLSAISLTIIFPIIILLAVILWLQDFKNPFYIPRRVGENGKIFKMVKFRSMIVDAELSGINSTSLEDHRITPIGRILRAYKLDEVTQLFNILTGSMSFVGPRPNVQDEVKLYTQTEMKLFSVKPGVTDFSSIVFSDEAEILSGKEDPNLSYNQLIRPWKSRLGIIYIENQSLWLDFQLIFYTFVSLFSKEIAVTWIVNKLNQFTVDEEVIKVASRKHKLIPSDPYEL